MSSPSLVGVPADVKHLICAQLWDVSSNSVRALSQVDASYHEVAEPYLYRGLRITATTPEHLALDVTELQGSRTGKQFLQHARHLLITGDLRLRDHSDPRLDQQDYSGSLEREPFRAVDGPFIAKEPLLPEYDDVLGYEASLSPELASGAWSPLVHLLQRFKHITDLVWDSPCPRLPASLIHSLQRHHSACRLHVRNFRFVSLEADVTDPDEYALITSQILHSLSVKYARRDSDGKDDFNGEAALRMVTLAPNLKHMRMLACYPASSRELYRSRNRPRGTWKGFSPPLDILHPGALESLALVGCSSQPELAQLETWYEHTDFSKLKELSFEASRSEVLMDIVTNGRLLSLERLQIYLLPSHNDEHFRTAIEDFFSALNPLKSIDVLGGLRHELLEHVCKQHGSTVDELILQPYVHAGPPLTVSTDDISVLVSSCHRLSTLSISIHRSMSNTAERAKYIALSGITSLKKLQIHLDCSNGIGLDPEDDWDEFNRTRLGPDSTTSPCYGHVQRALVNSAIDETLVRSIWEFVSGLRQQNIHRPRLLESLKVTSGGGGGFSSGSPGDLRRIVCHLSRSYLLTLPENEDQNGLRVVELSKAEREKADERGREHEKTMMERWGKAHYGGVWDVFRKLWPSDESDWREAWRSWPLER